MGCYHSAEYYTLQLPPCANCGKENGGYRGSTAWGHNHSCCSNACGIRLGKKIENGMTRIEYSGFLFINNDHRIELLRVRIDQLKNQLKANGIKPVK